jgi:RNA polymerase sigma-70 factor (ECF subfamily)
MDAINTAAADGLAEQLRRGDPGAATLVMRQHNRQLWRIARSILRDEADAEEVVQEAYLRAFASMDEFRADSALSTWLARIVINESIRRLHRRRETVELSAIADDMPGGHPGIAASQPSPEQAAAREEIRRVVERAIDALPASFRVVFVMRVIEQMSIAETAAALSIPEATVKTRLHRANQQLRQALGSEFASIFEGTFPFAGLRCERLTSAVLARLPAHEPIQATPRT